MYLQWQRFVSTGTCESAAVRPVTLQAWRRVRSLEVDPHAIGRHVLAEVDLAPRRARCADLLTVSQPYLLCLSLILAGKRYAVALADREGFLLEWRGFPDQLAGASGFVAAGADWSEAGAGNNGIGTAAVTREPVVVHGSEHYREVLHQLVTLGVPIMVGGELSGVLGVLLHHSETVVSPLPLMQACADAVSDALASLDRLKREIVNRQRFVVLGSQLATTVHDMRNPLTVIRAMGQLGLSLAARDEAKDMFTQIIEQVDGLTGMLDDLLDTSRAEEPVLASLSTVLREVFEAVEPNCAGAGIQTVLDIQAEPVVRLQVRAFKRAIQNLIANAIKAMPTGGRLTSRVMGGDAFVRIEIEDNGKGIPADLQPILFEPFVSGSGGKGLGLFMVHKTIVEDHRGRIDFESTPGKGTRFVIELPRRLPDEVTSQPSTEAAASREQ